MEHSAIVLDRVPLRIDPDEVRAFQGYKGAAGGPPAAWEGRLDEAIGLVSAAMRPRLARRTVAVDRSEPDRLVPAAGPALHIPRIGAHWGEVESVTLALVTVGPGVDALAQARVAAGDAAGAALLDSAASAAVECLAEWLNDDLCRQGVAAGLRVTNRISPGVAGWAPSGQEAFAALLPAAAIGVEVRRDGSLWPAKTISLLVGAGRAARTDHYFPQCRRCGIPACPWRRVAPGFVVFPA